MRYDLIIVGGGPGGVAGGIYAARKKIKAMVIAESFGGQSIVSNDIQNWVGTKSISGFDLAQNLEQHLRAQSDIDIVAGDLVSAIEDKGDHLLVTTKKGKVFETKYALIASGSSHRKLNVPGEKELDGKGVVYCSTCDAPLFDGKPVVVIGGGNAGLEAVRDLLPYATSIHLFERADKCRGDAVTLDKIKEDPKVKIFYNATTTEILGDTFVKGITYTDTKANTQNELAAEGVFVEIGAIPNSNFVEGLVEVNEIKEIIADPKTQRTSHPRIWAVGDVSDVLYKQNNISAGDAILAVLNIYETLHKE